MAKPFNRSLFAQVNGQLVRLGEEPQSCHECGMPIWEVAHCPHCEKDKVIRVCRNTLYHKSRPGLFFVHKPNQKYCCLRCELPENGTYSVGLLINDVSIEAEFLRHQHTPQHVLDMIKGQASHGIISPNPSAPVVPETLVYPMEVLPGETNREFVERTAILLSPTPETDKLCHIFKPPCSDITVRDFLEGKPPPAFFDANKDWVMRLKCDAEPFPLFDMNRLLWEQLNPFADKWVNEEGKHLLLIEFIERPQEERKEKIVVPPAPLRTTGDPKTQEERSLLEWFAQHGFSGMTMPRARDKKTLYIRVEGGVAVASLYGKTYYDAFLKAFAAQKPDIVSPFVAQRAWVYFPFESDQAREDWITHYDQVREACPQRCFGALKYLMTEDLMEAYPKYSKYIMDDPEKNLLYQDMVNDYTKLEKAKFVPYDGTVKLDKKKKKKKKKKKRKASPVPPPKTPDFSASPPPPPPMEERKNLKISFSKDSLKQAKKRKVEDDDEEEDDNPYDNVSDLESDE